MSCCSVPGTPISRPPKISWIIGEAMPMTPMPGAHVHAQDHPEEPELRRPPCPAHVHVAGGDHAGLLGPGSPPGRFPIRGRHPVAEGPGHHGDEVDDPHGHEGLPHPNRRGSGEVAHEDVGQRRSDHGATAEPHDGHARRHAAPVGKPLDQGADRRDVAQPQPAAADDARAEPEQPDLVEIDSRAPR